MIIINFVPETTRAILFALLAPGIDHTVRAHAILIFNRIGALATDVILAPRRIAATGIASPTLAASAVIIARIAGGILVAITGIAGGTLAPWRVARSRIAGGILVASIVVITGIILISGGRRWAIFGYGVR